MIRFPTEFQEFLRLLNSHAVDYLVVGGYAVAFHGHPRTTGDLDLWIETTADNVDRIRTVLRKFGFGEEQIISAPLHLPEKVIRMGNPPLRIEILTSISGVRFADCHGRRELLREGEFDVAIISREDLLLNKRVAGRAQDLADIEALARTTKAG